MRFKKQLKAVASAVEVLVLPLTWPAGLIARQLRRIGLWRLPVTRRVYQNLGVLPILDHYYEPTVSPQNLRYPLTKDRNLPALDLNVAGQLGTLKEFTYQSELLSFPTESTGDPSEYHYSNKFFFAGDAEYYYSLIRSVKPKRIIEIGSGHSTLMALNAVRRNKSEQPSNACSVTCIEPYHNEWLEKTEAKIIRSKVEDVDTSVYATLEAGDILFIDSSHVVRPQGDVLFEYFEILPLLKPGVYVHIHDIFTPKDYPADWVINDRRLWHEQYLVEAFLMYNPRFEIVGALNYLYTHHRAALVEHLPKLGQTLPQLHEREPASLWLRVVGKKS